MRRLTALAGERPNQAEFRWLWELLEGPSWKVAGQAFDVLTVHHHPQRVSAAMLILKRALDFMEQPARSADEFLDWLECRRVMQHAWAEFSISSGDRPDQERTELLRRLSQRAPDGFLRAQALGLLAVHPPTRWREEVLAALADPSEQVRVAALEIVLTERWENAPSHIGTLASSARPMLRRRAKEAIERLGGELEVGDYSEAVLADARRLASAMSIAGMRLEDVIALPAGHGGNNREFATQLARLAEDYLDQSASSLATSTDFQGILLLAASVLTDQRKLTLRLWEHEISRVDSDAELLDRGLEALAQSRFLAGLAEFQRGERTAGLQELASITQLARQAGDWSTVQVYVKQARDLSAEIWQGTVTGISRHAQPTRRPDSVTPVATWILRELDLTRPTHRAEARRRLDAWCGLAPLQTTAAYGSMAN